MEGWEWNLISEDDFEEFSFLLKREAEKTESSIPLGLTYIIMFEFLLWDHYNTLQLMVWSLYSSYWKLECICLSQNHLIFSPFSCVFTQRLLELIKIAHFPPFQICLKVFYYLYFWEYSRHTMRSFPTSKCLGILEKINHFLKMHCSNFKNERNSQGYLEKEMATHYSTLAWKIPWTEECGRLQSMGSQRVWHDWGASLSLSQDY